MENSIKDINPHPKLLDTLFTHKTRVSNVFRDILGLHEIHHIAVTVVNSRSELLTFSSTPAMEFNLFSSNLWRMDKTFLPEWFEQCTQASWQSLYLAERYDELYYLKQTRHRYPLGLSMAATIGNMPVIYSLASHKACMHTQELFKNQIEEFYKIGRYCTNLLLPLLTEREPFTSQFTLLEAI